MNGETICMRILFPSKLNFCSTVEADSSNGETIKKL